LQDPCANLLVNTHMYSSCIQTSQEILDGQKGKNESIGTSHQPNR
jgi:hypothetical protein